MPHNNYRIYSQGEYGVSTDDVAAVLGVGSSDVGTLCTSDNINMWAKYKPVRWSEISPTRSDWYKSDNNNYGIVPKSWRYTAARLQELKDASKEAEYFTEDGKNGWVHQQPEGGAGSPYRLGDFNGYLHTARPQYKGFLVTSADNWGTRFKVRYDWALLSEDRQYEVSLQDVIGKPYFHGVYAYQNFTENGNVLIKHTDDGNNESLATQPNHDYKLWGFFYGNNKTEREDSVPIDLYTCSGVPTHTFRAIPDLELWGYARQSGDFLYVNLYIQNRASHDITIEQCYVMSKITDSYSTTISGNEEIWVNNAKITIPASGRAELYYPAHGYISPKMPIANIHLMVSIDRGMKRVRIPIQMYNNNIDPDKFDDNLIEQ